ncbi:MAG: pyruvate synthase subunit beta [Chthonomonadaceae bacterium]|nr:pyruvate synthase subunit beta [Chthonomonadaceae bacterium]
MSASGLGDHLHVDTCEFILRSGNTNCAGCGMSLALQLLQRGMGDEPLTLCIPACCGIVTAGAFPTSAYGVPVIATTFASAAAVASGVSTVAQLNGDPGHTAVWAGDGGTYDIGMATLSAAAERNEDVLYFCYDNEVYGNTGGQRSGATPEGAVTSTTPGGKLRPKKDVAAILAAHKVPYVATLSAAHQEDFLRKLETAKGIRGFRFLLIHSPCPVGWKSDPADSVELLRLAVSSGLFPLYEVFDGERYRLNAGPDGTSVEEYFKRQGRFRKGTVDVAHVERAIADRWARLELLEAMCPADVE